MAFKSWNVGHIARFNSAVSSDFLDEYQTHLKTELKAQLSEPSHQTFAGSAFRCNRKSWFRLRGVQPDEIRQPDLQLQFTADIGTACHRMIQTNLKSMLKDDWIDVGEYLSNLDLSYKYEVESTGDGLETQIHVFDPPIMFACDGLIRWRHKLYLIEIKTAEFSSWTDLTEPKVQHVDQIKCYATLLNIHDVLFIYQDRQYGGIKVYQTEVTDSDMIQVKNRFNYVLDMVRKNIAPEGLPKNDPWCTNASMCPYFSKCAEYGR